ncbi:hypothetical protein [Litchfieldia salsa]|uniref:Uncharacterized protein n=1 Tax=Litchfieldia salsa TaxID=930152 RepID=A0A1H0PJ66_9BACI|nr:hypothetical protein [Litchfieldia salsa]SDP05152.1 hypothetical protein SAMN05216565_101344 [Litchfieldia salsa]
MSKEANITLDLEQLKKLLEDSNLKYEQLNITLNVERVNLIIDSLHEIPVNFHFDKVDVKENKGNINFGNNFGLKEEEKKEVKKEVKKEKNLASIHHSSQPKKEPKTEPEPESIIIKVNNKKIDYY